MGKRGEERSGVKWGEVRSKRSLRDSSFVELHLCLPSE